MQQNRKYRTNIFQKKATSNPVVKNKPIAKEDKRKLETRIKIQLGGALKKTGLPEKFGIDLEQDLQITLENKVKMQVLVGCLTKVCDNISSEMLDKNYEFWKALGASKLKETRNK